MATIMPTIADIVRLSDSIVREFNPRKIVLFGSHAWGKPSPDSDVDMLVILPFQGKSWQMAINGINLSWFLALLVPMRRMGTHSGLRRWQL